LLLKVLSALQKHGEKEAFREWCTSSLSVVSPQSDLERCFFREVVESHNHVEKAALRVWCTSSLSFDSPQSTLSDVCAKWWSHIIISIGQQKKKNCRHRSIFFLGSESTFIKSPFPPFMANKETTHTKNVVVDKLQRCLPLTGATVHAIDRLQR